MEEMATGVPLTTPVLALNVSPFETAGLTLYVIPLVGLSDGVFGVIGSPAA